MSNLSPGPYLPDREEIHCVHCGYNLRGLSLERNCPECGTPVRRSIEGNLLRFADTDWLRRMQNGVGLLLYSAVLGFVCGGSAAGPVVALLWLIGVVQLTTPEPRGAEDEPSASRRRLVRACAVAGFLGSLANAAGHSVSASAVARPLAWGGGLLLLAGSVAVFGAGACLRRQALRIPDPPLAAQTRAVIWGLVICGAVSVLREFVLLLTDSPNAAGGGPGPGGGITAHRGLALLIFAFTLLAFVGLLAVNIWFIFLLARFHRAFRDARQYALARLTTPRPRAP